MQSNKHNFSQVKKVAIFGSVRKDGFALSCSTLLKILENKGIDILIYENVYDFLKTSKAYLPKNYTVLAKGDDFSADLVFSLGGDGTFLKTAMRVKEKQIPILGIKLGNLGFLVDIKSDEIEQALSEIEENGFVVEDRTLLKLEDSTSDDIYALNEIAVQKLDTSSMIKVHATVNGEFLCTYRADGLLVSTPTGSTAYALSVGASIVCPQSPVILLAPISPHTLNQRPLVIPDNWSVSLDVECKKDKYLVSLDGHSQVRTTAEKIKIKKADFVVKVAKRSGHTYFQTLRDKLMWGNVLGDVSK